MAQSAGINAGAVTLAAAGGFLVYCGIRNVPVLPGLRDLAAGRLPAPRAAKVTDVSFTAAAGAVGAAGGAIIAGGAVSSGGGVNDGRYHLGAVKPDVTAAAYEVGPKFNIKTIYGWAPGQFDHPKGLALDFMINTPGLGKATGDALAGYVLANAGRLNVKYVIWYRRSWNPQRKTWVAYSGDSPHTDHVHVSFNS
jgi:hypothetical protein